MSNQPAESGFIEAPGAKLYYEAEGEGSPVILIHAGVAHLRMWDEQVAAWRDRHERRAVLPRQHGSAPHSPPVAEWRHRHRGGGFQADRLREGR